MNQEVSHERSLDEILRVSDLKRVQEEKGLEERFNELDEIEKLMEEELKASKKLQVEEPKHTKPKASNPMTFKVIEFTTPKAQVDEAIEEEKFDSGDDEEISEKEIEKEKNDPKINKMEVEEGAAKEEDKKTKLAGKRKRVETKTRRKCQSKEEGKFEKRTKIEFIYTKEHGKRK